jgi:probable rRNA maturation factor
MDQQEAITVMIESDAAEGAGLDAEWLARLMRFAVQSEGAPTAAVTLLVTDDAGIQSLHREYLYDDTPTDVLSFGAATEEVFPIESGFGNYLGDIAVSWDTAAMQGPEAGLSVEQEVAFLALHGLLHLLGADDATDADRAAMHDHQHTLLRAFLTSGDH